MTGDSVTVITDTNNSADDSIESWFKTLEEGKVLVLKEQNKDELVKKQNIQKCVKWCKKYHIPFNNIQF